ncbi:MAG: GNAT family N-acetyltransferase [Actinomycetota bacterium]
MRIARLTAEELDRLQACLPAWNSTEYTKRLAAQGRGELVQVVAWTDGRPVGKAMVLFPGHDELSVSAEREGCGEIRDVTVAPEARRLGVATAMIAALEAAVHERGLSRIGLSVALSADDAPARGLYARLGYAVAHGPFITSMNLYDDDGRSIHVGAAMSFLTKSLPPN